MTRRSDLADAQRAQLLASGSRRHDLHRVALALEASLLEESLVDFARGAWRVLEPRVIVLPMVGFDEQGYRLGYGGAYFDRTLAGMQPKPLAIGVAYELARLATIHPQSWDVAMDWVVTERGAFRREGGALALQQ